VHAKTTIIERYDDRKKELTFQEGILLDCCSIEEPEWLQPAALLVLNEERKSCQNRSTIATSRKSGTNR
jgi:hypothetical protein